MRQRERILLTRSEDKGTISVALLSLVVVLFALNAGIAAEGGAEPNAATVKLLDVDIGDYGARGDGKTLCTEAIQKAIDECAKAGGGRVRIREGRFLSGTIVMRSGVELHLSDGAVLLGSTDANDYPRQPMPKYRSLKDQGGFYALIYAEGAEDIALTGSGTIDGQGSEQKPRGGSGDMDGRPRVILFVSCKNVRVEGLNLRNSGMWMQHYLNCEDVVIRGLSVWNHCNRNNDGVDIDGCRRVRVSDCNFDTDDDAIVLKSTGPAACEDVVITNCTVSSHCNAIKAGTESTGGFSDIAISNCTIRPSADKEPIYGSPEGITGISLIVVDGGVMEGVSVDNIIIEGTKAPLYVRLGNRARPYMKGAAKPGVGAVRDITISNIIVYDGGQFGSSITGIGGHFVENISLSDIRLFSKGGIKKGDYKTEVKEDERGYPQPTRWGILPALGLFLRHVRGVSIDGLVIGVEKSDARAVLWAEDVQGLSVRGVRVVGPFSETKRAFLQGKGLSDYHIDEPLGWLGEVVNISD